MKKLLFVMPSLISGGAEKSLITLLSLIDHEKYSTDLFLFRKEGLFSDMIPDWINVIEAGEDFLRFDGSFSDGIKYFFFGGHPLLALRRLIYALSLRTKDGAKRNARAWHHIRKMLPIPDKQYDAAIGYLEGPASCFCIDCVRADTKILYVHSDYKKLGAEPDFDKVYFEKADSIVTVSDKCACSLRDVFPACADKVSVIYNITSPEAVRKASLESVDFDESFSGIKLLTVGRLTNPKGLEFAVEACEIMKKHGANFRWYVVGKGELHDELLSLAKEKNVEDRFILLGEKINPYAFMGRCDIYVQPSRYEGKSIAIDEAKCLAKPIVVTNFSTVFDQITDGVNGLICEMTPMAVADKIEMLINDEALRKQLSENLRNEKTGNEEEIYKLYKLIEG